MKKILFVIDSLNCGGAEKSLVSLLSLLNKDKYDISLWMLSPGGAFLSLVPNHITLVSQPKYNTIEKIKFYIGRILFSIMIRLKKVFHIKEHGAETLWKNAAQLPEFELKHTDTYLANNTIDAMNIDMIIGTLAGDDTAFLLLRDTASASAFCTDIRRQLS